VLNEYFGSVFVGNDSDPHANQQISNVCKDTGKICITHAGILNAILHLNNFESAGPNNVSANLFKMCPDIIASYLCVIFQQSIDTGDVPDDWKIANIIAIHKANDKKDPSNYRPISLTSVVSKMLEHILVSHIMYYLTSNGILSGRQFGFREGGSCELAMVDFLHSVTRGIDCTGQVDAIFLDFCKAFDKVNHDILIGKMINMGINTNIITWYSAFLSNRLQRVCVEGVFSNPVSVISGVPQGTVSGPVLFLIYINDIVPTVTSNIVLFADDVVIWNYIGTKEDQSALQGDLDNVSHWANEMKMNLNTEKSKSMHFVRPRTSDYFACVYNIDGHDLESCNTIKYLGVYLNKHLSPYEHICGVVKKCNRILYYIGKIFNRAPIETKNLMYKQIVHPCIMYASSVWDPVLNCDIALLESVQRLAARVVTGTWDKRACVTALINSLDWAPLNVVRKEQRMILFFKILNEQTVLNSSDYLQGAKYYGKNDHPKKLEKLFIKSNTHFNSFFAKGIREWNALPRKIIVDHTADLNNFIAGLLSCRSKVTCQNHV